ncbi:MAG: hypothetical protein J7M18_00690, partial [Candidatus Eremiobacteraeota bacterium]|nr:hypothetical protein [Candidatus Eremiobacteraeota bacterium]
MDHLPVFIGLERLRERDLKFLFTFSPAGIIIGHPFCPILLGKKGEFGLPSIVGKIRSLGGKIAYQTPVYITSRNFNHQLSLIRHLVDEGLVDHLLVHDPGLLSFLPEGDYRIVWDQYWL